jgi:hypothetical protein
MGTKFTTEGERIGKAREKTNVSNDDPCPPKLGQEDLVNDARGPVFFDAFIEILNEGRAQADIVS